jgi:syntaxin 1B/2/3
MNQVSNTNAYAGGGGGADQSFYNEIDAISESIASYEAKVREISDAHNRSLAAVGQQEDDGLVDRLMDDASSQSAKIKNTIKALERKGGAGGGMRRQQIGVVKEKFKKAIQEYQNVETRYRQRTKERLTRQYKLGASLFLRL